MVALERGLEGDSGLFTEDSGQEAEEEGRAKARGRPGQGGSGGEAEGAARPAPRACSRRSPEGPTWGEGAGAWLQCPDRKTLENF